MIKRPRAGRLALRHHAAVGGQPGGFFFMPVRRPAQPDPALEVAVRAQ
jgi:hypothetical protein